ncbi:MAG: hypothetical protein U0N82_10850 [Oscillospiraceae bacterium]
MKNRLYVFVQNDIPKANILENTMFYDLMNQKQNTVVIRENSKDIFLNFLARRKVQRIFGKLVNSVLCERYRLNHLLKEQADKYEHVYVLFVNTSFTTVRYPATVLKNYQKRWPNVKYILYYTDAVCRGVSDYANYLREANMFNLVYSFDSDDAEKYGMIFWRTPYSVKKEYCRIEADKDLYFIGVGTDRLSILCDLARNANHVGLEFYMDIVHEISHEEMQIVLKNVSLHSFSDIIPYYESLRRTLEAKCILEIVRPGQSGLTLRAYEAVVYNRKLLTNNKSILDFHYYDSRYMQYFEKVEDIDWDWVREDIEVDYHYNGEFSPLRLLEDIIKSCEEK